MMDNHTYIDEENCNYVKGDRRLSAVCEDTIPQTNTKSDGQQCVNTEMIPAKITYFLMDGYYGSINPFMNIFYVSLGLTASQAGTITGMSFVICCIVGPLWGCLADATGYRKLIYVILCVGTGSTVFSLPFLADTIAIYDKNVTCFDTINNTTNITHHELCSRSRLLNSKQISYIFIGANTFAFMFFASLPGYIHGLVMNVVNTRKRKVRYGQQKVFSSIGYAFFNFCSGFAVDHFKPKNGLTPYLAAFFVFLTCMVFITPIGYLLVGQGKWGTEGGTKNKPTTPITHHLLSVFKKLDATVFLVTVAVTGIANNVFQCFVVMLMNDTMKASTTISSLTITSCVVAELVVFPLSSRIIKLCGGPINSMAIGTLSYLPRFMLMTYVKSSWMMLPIQLFHGLGLSLAWAAEMEYTYKIFPDEIKLTATTIVASTYFVAAGAIANIVGGIVYKSYGGVVLFRGTALFCGAWAVFMLVYYGTRHQLRKRKCHTFSVEDVSKEFSRECSSTSKNEYDRQFSATSTSELVFACA